VFTIIEEIDKRQKGRKWKMENIKKTERPKD
jgi:hypothetical protein